MPSDQSKSASLRENEKKWGVETMALGYTIIPNVLIERMNSLGLDGRDLAILLAIIQHWWKKEGLPFPSKQRIANSVGLHARNVQKRIERMEADSLIERRQRRARGRGTKGSDTNIYNFDGLVAALKPFVQEAAEERQKRRAEDRDGPARKRPRLRSGLQVVEGGSR
jgi:hypothetical protein